MSELSIEELLGKSADLYAQIPTEIPKFGGISTKGVKQEIEKARGSRDELKTSVDNNIKRNEEATGREKESARLGGDAKADIATADQARAQTIADQVLDVNKLFGIGTSADDAIAVLAKENASMKPQMDAERANIQQMQSVGPLDNPVEWLLNGLQLPSKIQSFNTAATKMNTNQDAIEAGITNANNLSMQLNRGVPTITVAQAKATADKAKADAMKLGADADQAAARFNIEATSRKLASDMSIVDATVKSTGLELQNQELIYRSQINAISIASTNAERLLKAAQLRETLVGKEAEKVILKNAEDKLGYAPGSLSPQMVARMKTEDRDNIYAIGASSSFGNNPLDAYESARRARVGPYFNADGQKVLDYIGDKLSHINSDIENKEKTGGIKDIAEAARVKALPPDQKRAYFSGRLNNMISADIADQQKIGSLFHEFSPAKVMMSDKDFAESPVGKVLAPYAVKDVDVDPKTIAAALSSTFANPTDAGSAGASYYQKNIATRNAAMPFKEVGGIQIPDTYIITYKAAQFDLTKPGDYTKYILTIKNEQRQEAAYAQFRSAEGKR